MKTVKGSKALPLVLFFLILLISAACSPHTPEPVAQFSASDFSLAAADAGPAVEESALPGDATLANEAGSRIVGKSENQSVSMESVVTLDDSAAEASAAEDTAVVDTVAVVSADMGPVLTAAGLLAMQDGIG
jgi:hypothetical protein